MTFVISDGRNPKWLNEEHSLVFVEVKFDDENGNPMFDGGYLPFTADPNDIEEHGRAVFQAAVEGAFGEISSYEAPSLESQKETKLSQLSEWFDAVSGDAHVTSNLGFEIDADETSNRNIEGLIVAVEAGMVAEPVYFMDHNNQVHPVTLANLKTMRLEVIANGQALYQQKWALRSAIESAETQEELDAVTIPEIGGSNE